MDILKKFRLDNYCSIITGAAMGLGKAMAEALAEAGSNIVIADINLKAAEDTAIQLQKKNVKVLVVRTDVTAPKDCDDLTQKVVKEFGKIDVLVNNAGICIHKKAEEMDLADWNKVLNIILIGVFIMSQSVGKIMIKQKKGNIINIASMSGIIVNTPQCQCSYNASKAGVIQLTKSLASEWAPHNIRVNAIAPGYMKTELTRPYFEGGGEMVKKWLEFSPMGRPGNPEELGGIALYLASEASSFATGGVFVVDGGYTVW
jgi:NAD(P)-dependent dehydrogenase (short-subunit alcohol dehydrogenase family)